MNMAQLEVIVGVLGPIAAGCVYLLAKVSGPWNRFLDMLEDWHGEQPRPGYEGRPGVMVRLDTLEKRALAHTDAEIEEIVQRVFEKQDMANATINNKLDSIQKDVKP
jgi:non-ribosomal peptide synthetase component F